MRRETCFAHESLDFEVIVRGLLDFTHDNGIPAKITNDFTGRDRSAKGCIADRAVKGCRLRVENVCGLVSAGGPADITKQTCNFQALKLSIRRNLLLKELTCDRTASISADCVIAPQ